MFFALGGSAREARAYALSQTIEASSAKTLTLSAHCDATEGWNISVKIGDRALTKARVAKSAQNNGWTDISAALPDTASPTLVEILMEPATPPAEKKAPPMLYITCPQIQ